MDPCRALPTCASLLLAAVLCAETVAEDTPGKRGDDKLDERGKAALLDELLTTIVAVDTRDVLRAFRNVADNRWLVVWVDPDDRLHLMRYTNGVPPLDYPSDRPFSGGLRGGGWGTNAGEAAGRLRGILETLGRTGLRDRKTARFPRWEFSVLDPEAEIRAPRWHHVPVKVRGKIPGVSRVLVARKAVPSGAWGRPGKTAQVRIRSPRVRWPAGKAPVVFVDVRNLGEEPIDLALHGELFTAHIDGEMYRSAEPGAKIGGTGAAVKLEPGATHFEIPLVLDADWKAVEGGEDGKPGKALSLAPGNHTVRVPLARHRLGTWIGDTGIFSNTLRIEVVAEEKNAESEEEEDGNDGRRKGGPRC